MNKKIKIAVTVSIVVVIIIIAIISTFFILRYFENKNKLNNVYETYSEDVIQDKLEEGNVTNDDLQLKLDGENVIGVIKIDKINFEGLIYEGTTLDTLAKGVGHFENSSYLNGNVCLAAHNTNKFWAKLHTLNTNDRITYTSFLGTKEYQVEKIMQIAETDWTFLQNTDENILTLITCVKGEPSLRLCVQAIEVC